MPSQESARLKLASGQIKRLKRENEDLKRSLSLALTHNSELEEKLERLSRPDQTKTEEVFSLDEEDFASLQSDEDIESAEAYSRGEIEDSDFEI